MNSIYQEGSITEVVTCAARQVSSSSWCLLRAQAKHDWPGVRNCARVYSMALLGSRCKYADEVNFRELASHLVTGRQSYAGVLHG